MTGALEVARLGDGYYWWLYAANQDAIMAMFNAEPLDPRISALVDEHFWELV